MDWSDYWWMFRRILFMVLHWINPWPRLCIYKHQRFLRWYSLIIFRNFYFCLHYSYCNSYKYKFYSKSIFMLGNYCSCIIFLQTFCLSYRWMFKSRRCYRSSVYEWINWRKLACIKKLLGLFNRSINWRIIWSNLLWLYLC